MTKKEINTFLAQVHDFVDACPSKHIPYVNEQLDLIMHTVGYKPQK